jgi:hypothetical protein
VHHGGAGCKPSAPPSSFGIEDALKALEQGYRGAGKRQKFTAHDLIKYVP